MKENGKRGVMLHAAALAAIAQIGIGSGFVYHGMSQLSCAALRTDYGFSVAAYRTADAVGKLNADKVADTPGTAKALLHKDGKGNIVEDLDGNSKPFPQVRQKRGLNPIPQPPEDRIDGNDGITGRVVAGSADTDADDAPVSILFQCRLYQAANAGADTGAG